MESSSHDLPSVNDAPLPPPPADLPVPPVDDAPLPPSPADLPVPPVDDAPLPPPPADLPVPPVDDAPLPPSPADLPVPPVDDAPLPPPPADLPVPPVDDVPLPPPPADLPVPPVDDAPLPPPPADLPVPPVDDVPLPPPPADLPVPPVDDAPLPPPPAKIVQKEQPKWLLPAAGVLLVAGCGVSAFLHFQTESFRENAAEQEKRATLLQKDIDTLTENLVQEEKKEALSAEEKAKQLIVIQGDNDRLQELSLSVQKENAKLRQQHATLTKTPESIKADIEQKTKAIIDLAHSNTPPSGPVDCTTIQPVAPLFPPCEETDKMLREKVISYMKARKSGNIDTITEYCASSCYHMGSNGKELGHTEYVSKLKSEWQKYPNRSYRLLKVAYSEAAIEIVYWYSYTGKKGVTARGYAKERWDYNSGEKKVLYWQETHSDKKEPPISGGLRLINLK